MNVLETAVNALVGWPLALGALGVGVAGGSVLAWAQSRQGPRRLEDSPRVDLESRKESLYVQLRELDDTADKLDPELYAAEKARLLAAAAEVLRALDQPAPSAATPADAPAPATPSAAEAPRGWAARNPQLSGGLWGVGAALLVLGLWRGLDSSTRSRGEGESITGGGGMSGGGSGAAVSGSSALDAEIARLQGVIAANPDDLESRNQLGHLYIGAGKIMDAWKLAEEVAKTDPDNVEARIHQAVTLDYIGDRDLATRLLDKVLAAHPDDAEALGYRGVFYARVGDRAKALESFAKAKAAAPDQAAIFDQLASQVDRMADAGGASGGGSAPAAPEATGPAEFTVELTLAPGTASTGTLFVYVRPEGVTSGPPLRAKRMPASFPVRFTIGAADSPMGGALPSGKVQISARVDTDGNAMTKDPADPVALSAPIEAGASVSLELAAPK